MLYIDAVCKGIDDIPDPDPEIRLELKKRLAMYGIESVRIQLKQLDPDYYAAVDLKNHVRIVHALEICLTTGKPYSSFRTGSDKKRPFAVMKIGLDMDRPELHRRINDRVDKMVASGLEREARRFYPYRQLTALNTVGYREWFTFFDGIITRENAIEKIKRNTRRYARKQLSWFRNDPSVHWFNPDDVSGIIHFIQNKTGENER